MRVRYFGHTDVGRTREHNEDSHLADPELGLYVVADGVGGRAKGEVASQETVEYIWEWIKRNEATIREIAAGTAADRAGQLCHIVRGAIQNACYMVHSMGELDPDQKGMSTTASVFLVVGSVGIVGQVGDSRVYLVRNREVAQLTEDHTLINYQIKHGLITPEQAAQSRAKNVITRAVGHKDYVEVDTLPIPLFAGDRIVLCSDGFHGYVEQSDQMSFFLDLDVEDAVIDAIAFANDSGGKDNITVLLVELSADAEAADTAEPAGDAAPADPGVGADDAIGIGDASGIDEAGGGFEIERGVYDDAGGSGDDDGGDGGPPGISL